MRKKCNSLIDEFNNMEEGIINFVHGQMIKIIWLVRLIKAYNYCDLN